MRKEVYNYLQRTGRMKRRDVLKGMAGAGSVAAFSGVFTGASVRPVWAQDSAALRALIARYRYSRS